MKNETNLSDYSSADFDTEAMRIDIANGNLAPDFTADNADAYRHENIVEASLVNGQFTQARQQCRQYGLSYEAEVAKFRQHVY